MKDGWGTRLRRLAARGPGVGVFLAVCAGLAVVFFAEFVFQPGRMLFGTDMIDQAYQLRRFAVQEVKAGRGLPLWNPFVYSGLPYLGVLPGPVFYPTSLLYPVLPLFRAIGWTFVFHLFLAGGLGYAAGRAFGLRRWAAAATGLAFMFTGYMVSTLYGGHDGRMFAMALVPGVFACAERGLETEDGRWFLGMGLVVALQIFTPHVQVMYFSSLAVSLYALWRLGVRGREEGDLSGIWRTAAWFAGGFLVAAMAGAAQLLPAVDLLRHGVRGGGQGGYEFASSWALPPQELTALFLPDLIGSLQELYWGSNPFKLHTEYLGAGTMALAAVGALTPRGDRRVWFLSGATLLGVAFAVGAATPVHRIAYELVPLVASFRAPAMMLGSVSFFVCLLAGFGVERVLAVRVAREADGGGAGGGGGDGSRAGDGGLPWAWIVGLSAPFVLLALWAALAPDGLLRWVRNAWFPAGWPRDPSPELAGDLRVTGAIVFTLWTGTLAVCRGIARDRLPRWAMAGVLLFLVLDLWRVDARYLETVDPDRAFQGGRAVAHMEENLEPGERVWPLEDSFGPNELMYWRIPSVTGMQNFRLEWYDRLVGGVSMEQLLRRPDLWPLLDVKYLTVRSPLRTPLLEPAVETADVRLYRLTTDAPHAFFPDSVTEAGDLEGALAATRYLPGPRARMVVEPATAAGDGPLAAGRGSARVSEWHPDEIALDVRAEEGGLLYVSEVWHPGWTARVDGSEVPVYRANAAFRAVPVPAGSHEVRLEYRSTAFRVGAGLSLATVGGVLLVLGLAVRRRRE